MTESANPRRYWSNLKIQFFEDEGFSQLYSKTVQLKLVAPDGKMRETDTANTETIVRTQGAIEDEGSTLGSDFKTDSSLIWDYADLTI